MNTKNKTNSKQNQTNKKERVEKILHKGGNYEKEFKRKNGKRNFFED